VRNTRQKTTDQPPTAVPTSTGRPIIATVIGPKGGIGKTLVARAAICRYHAAGVRPRIVQIDRTPVLPALYGEEVTAVALPTAEVQRNDPLATMVALEPLSEAIDATIADGRPLVTDVGGGPSASATVEYIGKGRLDRHMQGRARSVVIVPVTSDPSTMALSMDLAEALEQAHPSARFVCALNHRDGPFRFFAGSAADEVQRTRVRPFIERHASITIPPIPAGALQPFETLHLRFTQMIEAEPDDLARQVGLSRTMTAVLQGDVAEWLAEVWGSFDTVLPLMTGGDDA